MTLSARLPTSQKIEIRGQNLREVEANLERLQGIFAAIGVQVSTDRGNARSASITMAPDFSNRPLHDM